MADLPTPADVEPELGTRAPDSSTGVRFLRRSSDSPTEEIELIAEDLVEEPHAAQARPKSAIPPLPPAALDRVKARNGADPPTPGPDSDPITRLQHELERVKRMYRDQSTYLAELETVFARRSQELLEADEREATLVRRFRLQTWRIAELEHQAREQTSLIQQLQASLPRRPAQTSSSELLQIRGIGPKYAETLSALGVDTIAALAALGEGDVTRIEQQLRIRNGRIQRERWVEQAKALLPTET